MTPENAALDPEKGVVAYSAGAAEAPSVKPTEQDAHIQVAGAFSAKSSRKDLRWSGVNMSLKSKTGGGVDKRILSDVWGEAKAGETTAIMGASGAGKTSLFNILAGRARSRGSIEISADICLGGARIDPNKSLNIRSALAFVPQEDALHEPSTPRQALRFSARLRLPRSTPEKEVNDLVENYIDKLGLSSCADSLIGGGIRKGISGGEKRRVSIGIELVSQPDIIFLDEPTSGLDSFAARQVVQLLRNIAAAGNTVLFTIHQPSSDVFASFDELILLNEGRLMYHGSTKHLPDEFAANNYALPPNYNPADWILDVAQINSTEELEKNGFFPLDKRPKVETEKLLVLPKRTRVSYCTELGALVFREKVSLLKNPAPMIINVGLTGFLSVVFGVIFFGVGRQSRANFLVVQGQLGAFVNVLISTMMGQSQTALVIFSAERPLFLREYSTDHYSIVTYFISHLVTEAIQGFVAVFVQAMVVYFMIDFQQTFLQFLAVTYSLSMTSTAVSVLLGAFFSDSKSASALFTLVVVPQFYFSGVFIAINLIPNWVRWAQYLCSLTYASRLGFIYEFRDCGDGASQENCDGILSQNGVDPNDEWWYWVCLVCLFVAFRLMALLALRQKGRDFS